MSVLQLFVEIPKGSEVLVVEGIRPLKVFKPQGRAPVDSGFLSTEEYQLNVGISGNRILFTRY